jgi:glycine/D-amino acid oxidase-like deaminating enzyme
MPYRARRPRAVEDAIMATVAKDVKIIGAGIIGCATAYFLARAGATVTVLDPTGIAAGASGRNNGLIEHPYDGATAELFGETVTLLREALPGTFPDEPIGTMLLCDSEAAAQALLEQYSPFPELEPTLLTPAEAQAAEPLLAAGLWGCALRTGYPIRPVEATTAFADLAREAGASFVLGDPVELDQVRAGGAEVVVATGASTPAVLADFIPVTSVSPLWGVIVSVDLPQRPRHPLIEGTLAAVQGGGAVVSQAPFTLLDSPSWLAVGSTLLPGAEPDGDYWSPRLLERGKRFVPSIEHATVHGTLVCARPRSFDNRPILGRVPGQDDLWIATGHGGRGMSLGAASGQMLAAAIIEGSDDAVPQDLHPSRLLGLETLPTDAAASHLQRTTQ